MSIYNTSNLYSVEVLVNGNTCKQYKHDGKTFIEAKHGSEYEIKINNNTFNRILAVSAVDGLNVLTGEAASEEDSGYVINGNDSMRIKGFRYSDDNVGAFKFTSKSDSYASGKGKKSSRNVGVIGVRAFWERINHHYSTISNAVWIFDKKLSEIPVDPYEWTITSASGYTTSTEWGPRKDMLYGCNENILRSVNHSSNIKPRGFDMGTGWGQVKESKVTEVEFEKGMLAFQTDIYYASRESLIQMGVPLTNEMKVTFPRSFPKKYATPPKNWNK